MALPPVEVEVRTGRADEHSDVVALLRQQESVGAVALRVDGQVVHAVGWTPGRRTRSGRTPWVLTPPRLVSEPTADQLRTLVEADAVVVRTSQQREAGEYVNAFEKLRDPSHVRCLSEEEWLDALAAAGLAVAARETLDKRLTFETWAARHTPLMQTRLRAMLLQAPEAARAFLDPRPEGVTTFRLREGLFIARRSL